MGPGGDFFYIKKCQKSRDTVPLSLQLQQALSFHVHIPIFYPDINRRGGQGWATFLSKELNVLCVLFRSL